MSMAALTRNSVVNTTLETSELDVGPSQRKAATVPKAAIASNESNPAMSASAFVGRRARVSILMPNALCLVFPLA